MRKIAPILGTEYPNKTTINIDTKTIGAKGYMTTILLIKT